MLGGNQGGNPTGKGGAGFMARRGTWYGKTPPSAWPAITCLWYGP